MSTKWEQRNEWWKKKDSIKAGVTWLLYTLGEAESRNQVMLNEDNEWRTTIVNECLISRESKQNWRKRGNKQKLRQTGLIRPRCILVHLKLQHRIQRNSCVSRERMAEKHLSHLLRTLINSGYYFNACWQSLASLCTPEFVQWWFYGMMCCVFRWERSGLSEQMCLLKKGPD